VNQRILELINIKKFPIKYIVEHSGSKKTTVANIKNGSALPNTNFIIWLFKEFPYLNAQWLFFGEGEMMFKEAATAFLHKGELYSPHNLAYSINKNYSVFTKVLEMMRLLQDELSNSLENISNYGEKLDDEDILKAIGSLNEILEERKNHKEWWEKVDKDDE